MPSAHDPYEDFELPVAGFEGTPEEIEQQWYEKVYLGRGDTLPQLTVRAVVMGSLLGGLLSLTNLYAGLKTGWGFGVSITASILSYTIWTAFYKSGLVRTQMGILETNCMKATSSSAGYSTGGTLISAYAAYMLLNHSTLSHSRADGLGVLYRHHGRDDGHPHETADGQYRTTSVPQRHRLRRNAQSAVFARRKGSPRGQGPDRLRLVGGIPQILGRRLQTHPLGQVIPSRSLMEYVNETALSEANAKTGPTERSCSPSTPCCWPPGR